MEETPGQFPNNPSSLHPVVPGAVVGESGENEPIVGAEVSSDGTLEDLGFDGQGEEGSSAEEEAPSLNESGVALFGIARVITKYRRHRVVKKLKHMEETSTLPRRTTARNDRKGVRIGKRGAVNYDLRLVYGTDEEGKLDLADSGPITRLRTAGIYAHNEKRVDKKRVKIKPYDEHWSDLAAMKDELEDKLGIPSEEREEFTPNPGRARPPFIEPVKRLHESPQARLYQRAQPIYTTVLQHIDQYLANESDPELALVVVDEMLLEAADEGHGTDAALYGELKRLFGLEQEARAYAAAAVQAAAQRSKKRSPDADRSEQPKTPFMYVTPEDLEDVDEEYRSAFENKNVEQLARDIAASIRTNLNNGMEYEEAKEEAQVENIELALTTDAPDYIREMLLLAQLAAAELIPKKRRK